MPYTIEEPQPEPSKYTIEPPTPSEEDSRFVIEPPAASSDDSRFVIEPPDPASTPERVPYSQFLNPRVPPPEGGFAGQLYRDYRNLPPIKAFNEKVADFRSMIASPVAEKDIVARSGKVLYRKGEPKPHLFPEQRLPSVVNAPSDVPKMNVPLETLKGTARELVSSGLNFDTDVLATLIVGGPAFRALGKIPLPNGATLAQVFNTPVGKNLMSRIFLPQQVIQKSVAKASSGFLPESVLIPAQPVTIQEAAAAARQGATYMLAERPLSPDEILELYKVRYGLEAVQGQTSLPAFVPKPTPPPVPATTAALEPTSLFAQLLKEQMIEVETAPMHQARAGRAALHKILGNEAGFVALPEDDDALKSLQQAAKMGGAQAAAKFAENINLTKIQDVSLRAAMQEHIAKTPGVAVTPKISNEELIARAKTLTDTPIIKELVNLPEGTLESQALRNREDALATVRSALDKTLGPEFKTELDAAIQQYRKPASIFARALQAQNLPVEARQLVVQSLDKRITQLQRDPVFGKDKELLNQLGTFRQQLVNKEFLTPDALDKLYFAWLNSILSSPITHAVNSFSNLAFAWSKIPEKFFSAMADLPAAAVTGKRTQYFGEIPAQIKGLLSKTKVPLAEGTKTDLTRLTNPFGQGLGAKTIGLPTQLLQVEDEFSKTLVGRMEMFGQAYKLSAQAGLKGPMARLAQEELIKNPSQVILNQVSKEQLYRTFQDAPSRLGTALISLRNQVPGVRFIIPFIRTPERILHAGLVERTPAQLIPMARKVFRWKTIGAEYSQEEFTKDAGLLMMGSSIAGWAGLQYFKGNITGNAPSNPGERAAFYAQGKKPNAFRVMVSLPTESGTKKTERQAVYVPFSRIEPWGTALSSVVNLMQDYGKSDKEAPSDRILDALGGLASTLTKKSYLSGLTNFISMLSSPEQYGGSFANRTIAGFIPQASNLASQIQNPYYLQPEGMRQTVMSRIPILSQQVPKRLGRFGEPQRRDVLDIGIEHITRVDGELNRLGHKIGFPSRTIGGRKLSNVEYNQLLEMAGPLSYHTLDNMVRQPAYQLLTDAEKMKEIDAVVHEDRYTARERMRTRLVMQEIEGITNKQELKKRLQKLRDQKVLTPELYFELKNRRGIE